MKAADTVLTVAHLFLWGQLGVVVRLYLVKLFQDGCSAQWGLCLTSGGTTSNHYSSYFSDLPPNMLGCFVIGFLSNHKTLGIKNTKPLGFLGHKHIFQDLSALHVGLRVGFCGCLTTFSSWELQMVTMIIGGSGHVSGQWAEAIWGWIIGTQLALVALVFGEQMAQYAHTWFNKEEPEGSEARAHEKMEPITGLEDQDDVYDSKSGRQDTAAAQHLHDQGSTAESSDPRELAAAKHLQNFQPGFFRELPVSVDVQHSGERPRGDMGKHGVCFSHPCTGREGSEGHSDQLAASHSNILDSHAPIINESIPGSAPIDGHHGVQNNCSTAIGSTDNRSPAVRSTNITQQQRRRRQQPHAAVLDMDDPGGVEASPMQKRQKQNPAAQKLNDTGHADVAALQSCQRQEQAAAQKLDDPGCADGFQRSHAQRQQAGSNDRRWRAAWVLFWDGVAVILAVAITALFVVLMIIDTGSRHAGERGQWLAILFAPAGAILRWQLSNLNGRLPKPLAFFPAGTFAANMLACAFDFAVQSTIVARSPLSYWPNLITTALKNGFMGSLSTVSTWATELRSLFKTVPDTLHGYIYLLSTILGGMLLGVVIYGWADWRH
ncbi:hypothetical protein WJX74_001885 [Apatococcus lobatus]|uniref:Fluoride ion transporter CrcB n=1 Tax=Apatococcus lobatus TaxID=904363 RepID=A0AAW1QIA2_9CHLO